LHPPRREGIADRHGLPVAVHVESATPQEVTLVKATIAPRLVLKRPEHLVGDAAYESDQLDAEMAQRGIELRYRRRWKVERLFAWLQNYRRVVVRYERHAENSLGMLHLACCLILLRCL
jgi:transposase